MFFSFSYHESTLVVLKEELTSCHFHWVPYSLEGLDLSKSSV